ncbi:hypothetical protein PENSPDRAFT_638385 [Peniophora sp. CONT]|nr:hypothetical protein PENSPDRAFT_638385 [Peniophora sp. CONT]
MPAATLSTPTSYSSRYARALSPPLSSAGSTVGPQVQSLKIVTRLAIEGNAKEGEGVPIKMYLKLALPVDNVIPGSAIPLFKEGDVKILDSEIHPLDHNSTPYNFSSSNSPLLHNAARALNLPARLQQSYTSIFESKLGNSSRYAYGSTGGNDPDRLDKKYTGEIIVSGFNVSFAVPRELPPRSRAVNGDDLPTPTAKERSRRRSSFGAEKNVVQFMAGISMVVPYTSRPPRAPWLVCIPTPRCLSNTLKLRIFSPPSTNNVSNSYQSLSSAETDDAPSWDMMVDPHVTRTSSARRPAYSYQHFADDEDSDSNASPGFSDGVGIQGSFPSTEVVHVRWAVPRRNIDEGVIDGRRRVGVESVSGDMLCTVLGRQHEVGPNGREGIVMKLEYKATCNGVFYPGVAALLGLDIGLEAKNCEVTWVEDEAPEWKVVGGSGYTGHSIAGVDGSSGPGRQPSFDMPHLTVPNDNTPMAGPSRGFLSRYNSTSSTSSTSSLLRTTLPADNVQDYSFENAPSTPGGSDTGMSSVLDTTDGESRGRSRASSLGREPQTSPNMPITIHVNMNELLTSPLTFSITGHVLVLPRSPPSYNADQEMELEVNIPRFSVLAAEKEKISASVRNGVQERGIDLLVCPSTNKHAKSVALARESRTHLSAEGGRATLRIPPESRVSSPFPRRDASESTNLSVSRGHSPLPGSKSPRPRITSGGGAAMHDTSLSLFASVARPRRGDAPLMLPYVNVSVVPHASGSYAVTARFPAPAELGSDWLAFYLLAPAGTSSLPRVSLVSTSLEGVPVLAEIKAAPRPNAEKQDIQVAFEQLSNADWAALVRIHVGALGGGAVEVVYVVEGNTEGKGKGKGKAKEHDILLPGFEIPVGCLQVDVPASTETLQTNLEHEQAATGIRRLLHYGLQEHFLPTLRIDSASAPPRRPRSALWSTIGQLLRALWWLSAIVPVLLMVLQQNDLLRTRAALESCSYGQSGSYYGAGSPASDPAVVTVTATVLSPPWASSSAATASPTSSTLAEDAEEVIGAPTPKPTATVTMIDVSSSTPAARSGSHSAHNEKYALLPPQYMYDAWPLWLEFDYRLAMEKVVEGLGVVWQVLRRAYHYPMDPP